MIKYSDLEQGRTYKLGGMLQVQADFDEDTERWRLLDPVGGIHWVSDDGQLTLEYLGEQSPGFTLDEVDPMSTHFFEFEGNVTVEITEQNTVLVEEPDRPTIEFSGFPDYSAAHEFVMFGDFEPLDDNDFLWITGRTWPIKYTSEYQ